MICNACVTLGLKQALHEALQHVLPEVLTSPSFPASRARYRAIKVSPIRMNVVVAPKER